MEDVKAASKSLYIPVNVVESRDFVSGFGKKELGITCAAFLAALIIAIVAYAVMASTIICVGIVVFLVTGTVMAVRRDSHNESIIDQLVLIYQYYQAQKCFEYEYKNIAVQWKEQETADE